MTYEFEPNSIPCPTHPADADCWCPDRVHLLEALALAARADVDLAHFVDNLDPGEVRVQQLQTVGPISGHVLGAMLAATRARFESATLIAAALDGADLPDGIKPPGRPSAGCAHLDVDPRLWGYWFACAAGLWRCDQCAATIGPPDCCDSCGTELDDDNRRPTVVPHWSSYRPPSALWPALLVVITFCRRCNDDDLDRLDEAP